MLHSTKAMPHQQTLSIFCDGGFGNRLNTLISGLATARLFELPAKVYWPRNNWCRAGFQQIFTTSLDVSEQSLSDLAGTLSDAIPLLHDSLGANTLKVPFQSAYAFGSLEEFAEKVVGAGKNIFYYPALIPPWLPMEHVVATLQSCSYQPVIHDTVVQFVQETIGGPFYGLHLRRTDLNVGYSDEEVQAIVRNHSTATFFVCSDDPITEALAAVHPHVHRRAKRAYVGKRNDQGDWMALTADDDGRLYHSNIDRNADSVLDGVIDMLILAHGSIVGFSGSTFQNMARLYGSHAPLVSIEKPEQEIMFPALSTLKRMVQTGTLSLGDCIGQAIGLNQQGRKADAIALERFALEYAQANNIRDGHIFLLHHNVGAHLLNEGAPYEASLYAEKALALVPDSNQARTLLTTALQVMHRAD